MTWPTSSAARASDFAASGGSKEIHRSRLQVVLQHWMDPVSSSIHRDPNRTQLALQRCDYVINCGCARWMVVGLIANKPKRSRAFQTFAFTLMLRIQIFHSHYNAGN
jgi:hypothetical protein